MKIIPIGRYKPKRGVPTAWKVALDSAALLNFLWMDRMESRLSESFRSEPKDCQQGGMDIVLVLR